MLLTIILPVRNGLYEPFHAIMLSFPQGNAQQVVHQLHDSYLIRQILDGVEREPTKLTEVSVLMAENGCPDVEIVPVDMVGYYQLQTC